MALSVTDEKWLSPRLVEFGVLSPTLNRRLPIRLLVPARWSRGSPGRWPLVYLLHGGTDDYTTWTHRTDVETFTAGDDVMIVMPEASHEGSYCNWKRGPSWETFHLTELRKILELEYGAGRRRAVAGASMGGLGALGYASRNPGFFNFVAAFSGPASILMPGIPSIIMATKIIQRISPFAMWGSPHRDAAIWYRHDPLHMAHNLRGAGVYLACSATGRKGPLDKADTRWSLTNLLEPLCARTMRSMHRKLVELDVPSTLNLYPRGTHSWPYWQRELHTAWPQLLTSLQ